MQAVLGINLPGYETRIPVFPNQLKVGHEYLYLYVGGLRQIPNRAGRQMTHRVLKPRLQRVRIVNIEDHDVGDGVHYRYVHYGKVGNDNDGWTSVAIFQRKGENGFQTYTSRDNYVFFMDEPMNRRKPLLAAWEFPNNSGGSATGGCRRTVKRRKTHSSRK